MFSIRSCGVAAGVAAVIAATVPETTHMAAQGTAESEIKAVLNEYVQAFALQDPGAIADRVVLAPSLRVADDGVTTYLTPADVKGRFAATLADLAGQNYQRSEIKTADVCIVSDTAALVNAVFVRYRKDGSILSQPSAIYVFARTPRGWRIVTQINNTPDRSVTCAR